MNNIGHTANNFAINYSAYPQQKIFTGSKLPIEVKLGKHAGAKYYLQVYVEYVWNTCHGLQSLQQHLGRCKTLLGFEEGFLFLRVLFHAYRRVISHGFSIAEILYNDLHHVS